jgi:para-aminobenzoate synthetase component 1
MKGLAVASWAEHRPAAEILTCLPSGPYRFLLESQGGPEDVCRYSFLGHRPFLRLQSRGRTVTLRGEGAARQWQGDPLEAMESLLGQYAVPPTTDLPPFVGGAVGYFSYDLGRQIEKLPATAKDDLGLPELWLAFYDHVLAIDHQTHQGRVIALPLPGREQLAIEAGQDLARMVEREMAVPPVEAAAPRGNLESNFTRAAYREAVRQALDHIAAGHIYQVNLSQRFSAPMSSTAESLYRRLRASNPAPFAAFIDAGDGAGDFQIVSASPERFLHYDPLTRRIETRPIKGTRPRGQTAEDDERLKAELLANEKDAAELVMIVDLERNDLGRVSDYGSVCVPDLRRLEAYPTVWHTVATVEGRLRPNLTRADLLRAAFPGGSITGAPKIRAMHIIEELEGLRRHVYCGAIGYLSFNGRMDLNIAIRTVTVKDGLAYFHAGGGIVADSQPDAEYDETLHKARALAGALGYDLASFHQT